MLLKQDQPVFNSRRSLQRSDNVDVTAENRTPDVDEASRFLFYSISKILSKLSSKTLAVLSLRRITRAVQVSSQTVSEAAQIWVEEHEICERHPIKKENGHIFAGNRIHVCRGSKKKLWWMKLSPPGFWPWARSGALQWASSWTQCLCYALFTTWTSEIWWRNSSLHSKRLWQKMWTLSWKITSYNIRWGWNDTHAAYYVFALNNITDMARVSEDATKPKAHKHVFCSAQKLALSYKALLLAHKKVRDSTSYASGESASESGERASVELQLAFEVGIAVLPYVRAAGNYQQATVAKNVAHTSMLEMAIHVWRSEAS